MRAIVITGGTDGMGAALARHYLVTGDRVTIVGRNEAKFDALLSEVEGDSPTARSRASFIRADLSLVDDTRRVVDLLARSHDHIDSLVLAASFIRRHRHTTSEGHEASWSLFFLSKYLLVTGLASRLRAAGKPVIVNTAVPGTQPGTIDFDDLELVSHFTFRRANMQQRRANELLGIHATAHNPDLSYVMWGPSKLVRTSLAGDVGSMMRFAAAIMGPVLGQSAGDAVRPVIRLIDSPVPGRAAFRGDRAVTLTTGATATEELARLLSAVDASLAPR